MKVTSIKYGEDSDFSVTITTSPTPTLFKLMKVSYWPKIKIKITSSTTCRQLGITK